MGTDNRMSDCVRPEPRRKPTLGWLLAAVAVMAAALTFDEVVEWIDGEPRLKQKQKERLAKEQMEIDNAEQYVLLALTSKNYPCLGCPRPLIFLRTTEVWKYGVTRKGQEGRYDVKFLTENKLRYLVQFRGTLSECLKEEKNKIFTYPLLPENLIRPAHERLARPPGNLRTD